MYRRNTMLFYRKKQKEKGMALILTVAIMLVLSIMAVTFVRLAILDQVAASNKVAFVDAKLTAQAGIERAKAYLWKSLIQGKTHKDEDKDGLPKNFWYPKDITTNLNIATQKKYTISLQDTRVINPDIPYSYSGLIGDKRDTKGKPLTPTYYRQGRFEKNGNFYALKIEDNQGKVNLNGFSNDNTRLGNFLDQVMSSYSTIHNLGWTDINRGRFVNALIQDPKPNSMQEVISIIKTRNLRPATRITIPEDQILNFLQENICFASCIDYTTKGHTHSPKGIWKKGIGMNFVNRPRSPININTASKSVIQGLIQGITAVCHVSSIEAGESVPIPYSSIGTLENTPKETSFKQTTGLRYPKDTEVVINFNTVANILAETIHQEIHHNSSNEYKPFIGWKDFEEFLINLPTNCYPTAPANLAKTGVSNQWRNFCVDALMANFNPNVQMNLLNPSKHYHRNVVQSHLISSTTEICFDCLGSVGITSLGRITANNFQFQASTATLYESISFSSIITQTTVNHFTNTNPNFKKYSAYNNRHVGWVEIKPKPTIVGNPRRQFKLFMDDPKNAGESKIDEPQKIAKVPGVVSTAMPDSENEEDKNDIYTTRFAEDGFFSSSSMYAEADGAEPNPNDISNKFRYYSFPSNRTGNIINTRDNEPTGTYIGNYEGAVSFWVKFNYDPRTPMPSNLFSATQISGSRPYYNSSLQKQSYNEGTQMFIFKDSLGYLWVSRLYFCGYFNDNGNYQGIQNLERTGPADHQPDYGAPPYGRGRKYARRDIRYKVSDRFQQGDWYHIAVTWNDTTSSGDHSLRLYINGRSIDSNFTALLSETSPSEPTFCIANERATSAANLDGIIINGISRSQHSSAQAGILLRYNNNAMYGLGEATISDVQLYTTRQEPLNAMTRFMTTQAVYQDQFDISQLRQPIPAYNILRKITWDSYPRVDNSNAVGRPTIKINTINGATVRNLQTPDYSDDHYIEGRPQNIQIVRNNGVVPYELEFKVERALPTGTITPPTGTQNSPSLDSVTLHLLSPRVSFWETLD